ERWNSPYIDSLPLKEGIPAAVDIPSVALPSTCAMFLASDTFHDIFEAFLCFVWITCIIMDIQL
ncbi:hypothetical protein ACJX0J_007958, partial [Zea mays]